ncbi:MAG: histidine ammonia-lyase [archaeon]
MPLENNSNSLDEIIEVNGDNINLDNFIKIARFNHKVKLSNDAKIRIKTCREVVDKLVDEDQVVYGLTTGFGSLYDVKINKDQTEQLQENLLISHACSVGDALSEEIVRGIMLLRINTFAKGYSGIRLSTVEKIIEMLNKQVYAYVPKKGSVGSSGDLSPLSHLFLPLIGEGEIFIDGKLMPAREVFKKLDIETIKLSSKEGLALNNGTPVMTSIGAIAVYDAKNLLAHSLLATSLTYEALRGNSSPLNDKVNQARPHKGQLTCARILKDILKGSQLVDSNKPKVQDAYSLRASSVVIGASLDAINYIESKLLIEMNSATDNPLIIDGKAISAANFHGQPMALALDFLAIAISELGNISDRRIFRMIDSNLNEGLPPFLITSSGLSNGFMIPQYTTAALVSENKVLAHPASVDSIPTCANQEDHVSMGAISANKALEILENTVNIIGIELMVASQAIELREKEPSAISKQAVQSIRKKIAHLDIDRVLYKDINIIADMVRNRDILKDLDYEIKI